ncbi:MAG TPA: hypothetical protein DEE98_03385 [Elusimicrobia bacterium]|nr:MAG: hypothetical protein A2278_08200 [Elusimicrobia bacterium RIFOXYA12_FULL_49_49]OGS11060.1 MAG: hypothetical protein A2386_04335 [Elusimicrobia bacterium RIFOXYB1_FULL_48_9]OGS15954.1 MAG: hypothetical protein A2251_02065 [Elusimicrobia bacterium RIFOXYA2_FULL_47_53]OGS26365.1 MAG: hypothetical protein A2339_03205 [Elusimicrobia bacterium RIFOXYB12_FULL_50_12]OGS29122.1 MAG: hypothetical protein A2323_04605 [Elusimicrobia bacterium RIFOXYB2_FULL_46_23]HBU69408.1 hypothetical protein [El
MLTAPETAVVIPTLNEEASIAGVIDSVSGSASNIYVIDGGSKDKTVEIALSKNAKVIKQKSRGKGSALVQALNEINAEIIVFIDADGSHEAADIPKLVEPIVGGKAELVVASRYLGGSDELHGSWNNFVRMVGSSLITLGMNYRWNVRLTDVENGFRAVRRSAALKLELESSDFTIEQEMVMKAVKNGLKVVEVASHEYERKGGVSKLPTSQGWKFIYRFFRDII